MESNCCARWALICASVGVGTAAGAARLAGGAKGNTAMGFATGFFLLDRACICGLAEKNRMGGGGE